MPSWNPEQYLKFEKQRTQPSLDLIGRVEGLAPADILDVGCGPGNSTEALFHKFSTARILGVDSSPDMVAAAKQRCPQLEFALCDVSRELSTLGQSFDLVFSNACLQWVPNHKALLPELFSLLTPGGVLAVQVPMAEAQRIYKIIAEVSGSGRWRGRFASPRVFHTLAPEAYYDVLAALTGDFDLWKTDYYHVMQSHTDILEWYRGTGLRPYLEALHNDGERAAFEAEILAKVEEAYPKQADGNFLFPFPRLFFVANKG